MPEPIQEQVDLQKGYVALAVNWQWDVDRVFSALQTLFGYNDWDWIDPGSLHCTLAYSDNITDAQLIEVSKVVVGTNACELHIIGIGVWPNDATGGQVVYLKIEPDDSLVALQTAVYDSLAAQGVEVSPVSNPASWVPHLTMAYAPPDAVIPESELDLEVYACRVTLSRDEYNNLAEIPLKREMPENYTEDGMGPVAEMASWKLGGDGGNWAIGKDLPWDGAAAAKSVFAAAKFDSDTPDLELVRKAFLLYNASAPKLRSSYKLPIAKWSAGKLIVMPQALRNAASRAPQVKGVAADVMKQVSDRLDLLKKIARIGEMNRQTIELTFISEMRGNYPDIPLPTDINLSELKALVGDNLDFVTLPIGQVDALSGNGRTYQRSAVEELVQQVNAQRPEGMWGHLTEEEMATRYDPPAIRWLAAMLDKTGVAWAKGLPLDARTREYYRLAKATNARVGTSLTALAEMRANNVEHIELKTIDLADPTRVGIPITAAKPQLTQEMQVADEEDVIVRIRKEEPIVEEKEITELVGERDSLKTKLAEMQAEIEAVKGRETTLLTTIGELLAEYISAEVKEQVSVESARDLITEQVITLQPQNRDAVKTAVQTILNKESVKKLLQAQVAREMGPVQTKQQAPKDDKGTPKESYFDYPEIKIPQRQEA